MHSDTVPIENDPADVGVDSREDRRGLTVVRAFGRWARRLSDHDSRLILAGVDTGLAQTLTKSGMAAQLGAHNVVPATEIVFEAVETAYTIGEDWLKDRRSQGPSQPS